MYNKKRDNINTINRFNLLTEKDNPRSKNIDIVSTDNLVDIFLEEDKRPQDAVSNAKKEIVQSIDLIYKRILNNGRIFYVGAGTSGRLAVLDAAECPPTFCTSPELVQAIIAGGYKSMINSSEDAEDNKCISVEELKKRNFNSNDCLIGISAGGTTPFVLSALNYSKEIGALNIAITCVPENEVFIESDIVIRLITGPEIITGSTRLKAGTATKMVLNILSTGIMIKLGKVFGNKMIDLSIKNCKLLDRSIRIMTDILDIDRLEALSLLDKSRGSVKLACLMKLSGLTLKDSLDLLSKNNGNLRTSLIDLNLDISELF